MADTLSSGGSARKGMGVQVSPRAQKIRQSDLISAFYLILSPSGNRIGNHMWGASSAIPGK